MRSMMRGLARSLAEPGAPEWLRIGLIIVVGGLLLAFVVLAAVATWQTISGRNVRPPKGRGRPR